MTVSAQTPINSSTGNGVTTVFPYGFKIVSESDIEVIVDDVVKTLNVDYTVSGVGDDLGGNVTMAIAPASPLLVVRRRNMALVRDTDYQDQGEIPAETLDRDFDAAVLMIQQVDEQIGRAVTVAAGVSGFDGELPDPVANMFLRINSAADGFDLASEVTPGALTVTPYIETLLNDTDATAARTTLGAQIAGSYQPAGDYAANGDNNDITRLLALAEIPAVIKQYVQQIKSLPDPTLAGNALTLPASTHSLDFRSATLGSGVPVSVTGTAAALTIPAGATLGTGNGVQGIIAEVICNSGGVLHKAVVNLAGGRDLSESGVINTTAISGGATAANVFYSNTALTNVPYRLVRSIISTQAAAGLWATPPSLVQGAGGQSMAAIHSLGYGQTRQALSVPSGVRQYNTSGKPISLFINMSSGVSISVIDVNGYNLTPVAIVTGASTQQAVGDITIPAWGNFMVTYSGAVNFSVQR